jgi:hypothetical protein
MLQHQLSKAYNENGFGLDGHIVLAVKTRRN